jgi:hypothetical protein
VASDSGGLYAADPGSNNSFAVNAKFSPNYSAIQGSVNVVVRHGGSNYQIKATEMQSLVADPITGQAELIAQAKLTNLATGVVVGTNLTLDLVMTDNGEPGSADTFALTLWNSASQLYYSSSWNGVLTSQQLLRGGNLQVHGHGSAAAGAVSSLAAVASDLTATPASVASASTSHVQPAAGQNIASQIAQATAATGGSSGNVVKSLNIANSPAATETSTAAGNSGVASALSAPSAGGAFASAGVAKWLVNRLQKLDLNSGPIARYFEHLAHQNTPAARKILLAADKVADRLGLDDSLLDILIEAIFAN